MVHYLTNATVQDLTMGTRGNGAILLVEDDEFLRAITIAMLRTLGHVNVTAVVNGEEAVKACEGAKFDLILMDCEMPVLDGLDATRRIRAQGVRTPVVAYTASVTPADRSRCIEAGMDDFLAKPARPSQLAMKLHQWLATRSP
jgi:CheY-like chemotaxis protein